jgi:putative CocE/NonD family hydrolase
MSIHIRVIQAFKQQVVPALILVFIGLFTRDISAQSHNADSVYLRTMYDKYEYKIPMRDGIKLFTVVYVPKDKTKKYPILMNRTCYNASTYADFKTYGHPSDFLVKEGFILVFQDVRGRYMSEGVFNNMTPNIPGNEVKNKKDIDESSDTYDTIEWLLKKLKGDNGKVGIFGISYPGFYSAACLPDAHPALVASSPQAPISDFFFDDFHHNGAYLESYTAAFAVFGYQQKKPSKNDWFIPEILRIYNEPVTNAYDFYLKLGPLKNITQKYHHDNFFWKQITEHPNYDEFWQKRNILPHLTNIHTSVLTVGGWFDAEDLYGPLHIYRAIEKSTPGATNTLVMGPWGHGDWAHEDGLSTHNHICFGDSISTFYQREIELPFFKYHLKGEGSYKQTEAYMFNTGTKDWHKYNVWPPKEIPPVNLTFGADGKLYINQPKNDLLSFNYVSDPANPVQYTSEVEGLSFTPRAFMSDDQRHASLRKDVLTFQTDVLTADITFAGPLMAKLMVAITGTDADFIVKLIDVYPDDEPECPHNPDYIHLGGYQQLVRSEVFRGRFRNSFEKPEPFVPGEKTDVNINLQDVLHTFKKGHRVMIQIHSTWFPYIDRNPQKYVDNIYNAEESDFIKSTITIYGSSVIVAGDHP